MSTPPDRPERESRALGDVPPPRPGVQSHAELRAQAKSDKVRAFLDEDEQRARESRLGVPGQLVAYYTGAAAVFHHVLPERELRLSSFDRMRDPRENREWVRYVTGERRGGTVASLEEVFKQANAPPDFDPVEAMAHANLARQRGTKVLCLTSEPATRSYYEAFVRCYSRPRMWEQYGDNRRGVCLVFDKEEFHAQVLPQLEEQGTCWYGNVTYDNAVLAGADNTAHSLDGARIRAARLDFDAAIGAHFEEYSQVLFFTKMEDYSDETEMRYIVYDGGEDEFARVRFGLALRAVVLGEHFPHDMIPHAIQACGDADVAVRRIDWRAGPLALKLD